VAVKFSRIATVLGLLAMMLTIVAGQDFSCMAKKLLNGNRAEITAASSGSVSLSCKRSDPAKQGMLKTVSFPSHAPVDLSAVSVKTCPTGSTRSTQRLQATPLAWLRAQRPSQAKSELRI
jgi:hypothetical protein